MQGQHEPEPASLLTEALGFVTRAVSRRPKVSLVLALLVAAAATAVTVCRMEMKTRRADLIDPQADFHQRWTKYAESFGDATDVVVVVEGTSPGPIRQALDEVGTTLKSESALFSNVLYRVEPGPLQAKGLHYLSPAQLDAGLQKLAEFSPVLEGRWDLVRLEALFQRFHYQLQQRGPDAPTGEIRPLLEHAWMLSRSMEVWLNDANDFRSPWPMAVPVDARAQLAGNQPIYFLNNTGTMGFLKAVPTENQTNFTGQSKSLDRLREIVADTGKNHPDVKISVTGIPVLENDEMRKSQSDMLLASIISYVGVGLLMLLGFRGWRYPLMAMAVMAVGMAWAFGFTTVAVGHLNILSVSFAAILIGLGDFSVCFMSRYLELRHEDRPLRPALIETASSVGPGIVTAAITTTLSFLCATLTDFLGVAELGIIAGGGIILCMLAVFIVLPALIMLADQKMEPGQLPTQFRMTALQTVTGRFPWIVLGGAVCLIAVVVSRAFDYKDGEIATKVTYDHNLLHMQADGLDSVEVQKRIFENADDSLLFAVATANSPQEARALREKFEKLPTVHHVEELASRLPAHAPDETKLLVQAFRARLARLPQNPPQVAAPNPSGVGRSMEQLYMKLRKRRDAESKQVAQAIDGFLDRFESLSVQRQVAFLNEYQYRMSAALLYQLHALNAASNPRPVTLEDLPPELTSRFVSKDGKWLVQVFPKEQLWDVEPLQRFVDDVRSVDPEVTGVPLQNFEASRQIRTSYEKAATYAFAVVWVVLLVDFLSRQTRWLVLVPPGAIVGFLALVLFARRTQVSPVLMIGTYVGLTAAIAAILDFKNLRDSILVMLPPLVGGGMMFGILGLLGVHLNPANLIVLPLVLGIGVENGVHVVHDYRRQGSGYVVSSSMINANLITSLTTMIGFGSMMVAAHRGLYSLGLVLTVGVGCSLFVSMAVLPAMLTILARGRRTEVEKESAGSERPTHPIASVRMEQKAGQARRAA